MHKREHKAHSRYCSLLFVITGSIDYLMNLSFSFRGHTDGKKRPVEKIGHSVNAARYTMLKNRHF